MTRSLMCHTTDLTHHFALIPIIYVPRGSESYFDPMFNILVLLHLHCQSLKTRPFEIRTKNQHLRASLETTFFQGIFIFPREISLFSHGKIEIPWENEVPKLALNGSF
jgi:hypothetical protein